MAPVVEIVRRSHNTLVHMLTLIWTTIATTLGTFVKVLLALEAFFLLIKKWHFDSKGNARAAESDFRICEGSRVCG